MKFLHEKIQILHLKGYNICHAEKVERLYEKGQELTMARYAERKNTGKLRILLIVLLVAAACGLIFSVYKIITINQSYQEASDLYSSIEEMMRPSMELSVKLPEDTETDLSGSRRHAPSKEEDSENVPSAFHHFKFSSIPWNYQVLLDLNEDSVGWIYQDGVMSYPVVQAEDNDKYLRNMINLEYNAAGTLFVDYRCTEGLNDRYSIIYGHNMDDGSMFGSLTNYSEESYYKEHPSMELYIGNHRFSYQVYAAMRIEVEDDLFTFEPDTEEFLQVMENLRERNSYEMADIEITADSKVVVLSTCVDYPRNYDYRYVVVLVRDEELLDQTLKDRIPTFAGETSEQETDGQETAED